MDEKTAGLDDDDPEDINDETDIFETPEPNGDSESDVTTEESVETIPTIDRSRAIAQRARIRTRLADVVEQAPRLHPMARQAAAWLVLIAQQSGVYDTAQGDDGWGRTLAPALAALDHTNADGSSDIPDRLLEPVASTAAVGLFLLHDALRANAGTADLAAYRQVANSVNHLLPYATTEQVASYAHALLNANGFPIDEEDVLRVAGMAVQADEMITTIDLLESAQPEWTATKLAPRCLHVQAARSAPMVLAATALDLLATVEDPVELAACWGTNDKGDWCLLARDEQDLWRVEVRHTAPAQLLWTHHLLSTFVGPLAIAKDQSVASRTRQPHGPHIRAIPEAVAAFEHCGADVRRPPISVEPMAETDLLGAVDGSQ